MVSRVASALGPELSARVAFVGGCAAALLVTDPFTRQGVRFTDDVDVIVQVIGRPQWYELECELRARGFYSSPEDELICRMRLRDGQAGNLIVDFMPDDELILGFSNRWYGEALDAAELHTLPNGVAIRLVTAPYFLATKLQAYRGRGNNNPLESRDVEDIINVVDGRVGLAEEIVSSSVELRQFVRLQLADLMGHQDFEYLLQSSSRGDRARHELIAQQLELLLR